MIGTPCVCGERNTWHKKCYQNQAAELKLLRKQRDELLAALDVIAQWNDGDVGSHMDEPSSARIARLAIASVKGGA